LGRNSALLTAGLPRADRRVIKLKTFIMATEPALFRQVLQCFARFPQRQDTLQGITQWWLMENRIEWAVTEVQAALDELVARDLVVARRTADGQTRYKINATAREAIEALLLETISNQKP
jgi:hypothetical protein